ncbi:MAG: nitroreductase family protein [Muribaculaceae bacterium]|nr:nitroreductase family protein [Muribaculaceae bacterium]
MKHSALIIILLAIGLVFVSYKWVSVSTTSATEVADASSGATAIDVIMTRSSVRSYTDRDISKECMDTLLRAAMAAPTAANKQPWRFVVIRDRETLNSIGDKFEWMKMMKEAPVAVVVCGDINSSLEGAGREYWVQDASAASENLLLAAHAIGLGAVWCGVYPIPERVMEFRELLALPDSIIPLNCIGIGYPAGDSSPKDKWKPEYIHFDKW